MTITGTTRHIDGTKAKYSLATRLALEGVFVAQGGHYAPFQWTSVGRRPVLLATKRRTSLVYPTLNVDALKFEWWRQEGRPLAAVMWHLPDLSEVYWAEVTDALVRGSNLVCLNDPVRPQQQHDWTYRVPKTLLLTGFASFVAWLKGQQ